MLTKVISLLALICIQIEKHFKINIKTNVNYTKILQNDKMVGRQICYQCTKANWLFNEAYNVVQKPISQKFVTVKYLNFYLKKVLMILHLYNST